MRYINSEKHKRNVYFLRILSILLLLVLIFISVKIGTIGADLLYEVYPNFLEDIDTQYFKEFLTYELPIVDIMYNSGKINTFTNEINHIVNWVFGFEFSSPVTIITAQSPIMDIYYSSHYLPMLAQREKGHVEQEYIVKKDNQQKYVQQDEPKQQDDVLLKEDASSISFGQDEKKDIPNTRTIDKGEITIFNETDYNINIDKYLNTEIDVEFDRLGPQILVYHTHTTESFITSIDQLEDKNVPTRSRDPRYNVVRIGDEITRQLKDYGFNVVHNGTIHDYPDYDMSYVNANKTLAQYLKSYPSVKIAIDVHRDAVDDEKKLRVTSQINGQTAAKIMFVIGAGSDSWESNLALAVKLQQRLNEIAPGLAKHIYISKNRYNQYLAEQSLLVEIGGDGNLLEECLISVEYLSLAMHDVIKP